MSIYLIFCSYIANLSIYMSMYRSIVLKNGQERCINKENNDILFLAVLQTSISCLPYKTNQNRAICKYEI